MADCHVMAGKGYAFVTYAEPTSAQSFLEVRATAAISASGSELIPLAARSQNCMHTAAWGIDLPLHHTTPLLALQQREHFIDGRRVDAKAAVPKDQGGGRLTKKMFVGGLGDMSDEEYKAYWSQYGNITDAVVSSVLRGGGEGGESRQGGAYWKCSSINALT